MSDDWQPISTAPKDREIEVWNAWAGDYRTKYEDGEYPLRGPQQGGRFWKGGVWYPVPSKWRPINPPDMP